MNKISCFRPSLRWKNLNDVLIKSLPGFTHPELGPQARPFERVFADHFDLSQAITVPSGRMGLYLILKYLGLEEGSQIIISSFNFWAIPKVISLLKLEPIFVDINPHTYTLDPALIETKITKKTRAILVTHLYGLPCPMDKIMDLAHKYKFLVIEDCVQACGAKWGNQSVGSIGDAAYFSFGNTKNLILLGSGMITLKDEQVCERVRKETVNYPALNRYDVIKKLFSLAQMKFFTDPFVFSVLTFPVIYLFFIVGEDVIQRIFSEKEVFPESELKHQARLLPGKTQFFVGTRELMQLTASINKRRENARYLLSSLSEAEALGLPQEQNNIFTSFPLRVKNRDKVFEKLLKKGVCSSKGFMKAFGDDSIHARALEKEILHLPVYPFLSREELSYIGRMFLDVYRESQS